VHITKHKHHTHTGFDVQRTQAPRRVEQQRHVLSKQGLGRVVAVVGAGVHELQVLELDFQLPYFARSFVALTTTLQNFRQKLLQTAHARKHLRGDHCAFAFKLHDNAHDIIELRTIFQSVDFDVTARFDGLIISLAFVRSRVSHALHRTHRLENVGADGELLRGSTARFLEGGHDFKTA
jgi:hypothetical protein